jgi:hypothetical protein
MNSLRGGVFFRLAAAFLFLLPATFVAYGQQASGSISGTVTDKQGAVVAGARVTLIDQERAGRRTQTAGAQGGFVFDLLPPSNYTVQVEAAGFKKWEKTGMTLYPSDRIGVTDIVLEVGGVSETVTVEATSAQVKTESADVSGVVTSQQMSEIGVLTRNFIYELRTLPGVTNIDIQGRTVDINGQRPDQTSFKLDGVINNDYGDNACCNTYVNMDTIAEIKLVSNSATADMGSNGGAHVIVTTKSGSKEFHGNAYFFKRAEFMNANSWTNNQAGLQRTRDRTNQGGFTLGGPLFIPGKFNRDKNKLFFFVSSEAWKNLTPSTSILTVPTALERKGDFTQSVRNDNSAVTVLDPLAGRTPFPGNVIPLSRQSADAIKLMNLFPLPNVTGQTTYNYRATNTSGYYDRLLQSYRIDYNISEKWRLYGRYSHDYQEIGDPLGMASFEFDPGGKTLGWNLQYRPTYALTVNLTTIINPKTTNEVILGASRAKDNHTIDKATYLRGPLGLNFTLPNPSANVGDFGPYVSFAFFTPGLSNAPRLGTLAPYIAYSPDYTFTDNFTRIFSRHTLKIGFFYELDRKDQDTFGGTSHAGRFSFTRDSQNPGDTDYQFANLLTGAFQTFDQVDKVRQGRYVWHETEAYVSDTWKVKPNLTLDYGVRIYNMEPGYDARSQIATFNPAFWDPAKAVSLYSRAVVGGRAVTINPLTGATVPNYLLGAIVPGSGDPNNGFVVGGTQGIPQSLIPQRAPMLAPRLGIAWQPKFLPKTVIRAGSGVFYDRIQGNVTYNSINFPPTTRPVTLQYGYLSDISASQGTIVTPPSLSGGYVGSGKIPTTVNWNFAVERELPYATLMTVSYVGSISRHLIYANPVNEPAFGSAWLPQNQDPTLAPKFDGSTTLPINFYRPYRGIGQLDLYSSVGSANYNALQVAVNKRLSRRISYGLAYTWSKTLGLGQDIYATLDQFNIRQYSYGRVPYDRTQVLTLNFIYNLPKAGKNGNLLDHPGIRLALNDWEIAGLITAQTGTPLSFNYSFSNGINLARTYTGSDRYNPRPVFVGAWQVPPDQVKELQQFNVNAFVPASRPSVGLDSGQGYWSNPGTFLSSPEIYLYKNFRYLKDDKHYIQFRLETYNVLNHHDWTGRNTSAQFRSPTDLTLTNLPLGVSTIANNGGRFGFGALNGAAAPRRVQLSLKLYF